MTRGSLTATAPLPLPALRQGAAPVVVSVKQVESTSTVDRAGYAAGAISLCARERMTGPS
jgi:hypothetical protein